ncbi:MAG: efflux RND transporter permease subunit [bacterium]|nr:efflux RND transporter permease subunit [bacterium]
MKLVEVSIRYPVSVIVGVLFCATFGILSFYRLPVQLIPTVDKPEISVETWYLGAGPLEVEEEVTARQEELLNTLENLKEMQSTSSEGRSQIVLKYEWGTNKDVARIDVSEKLAAVRDLPDDIEEPIVRAVNSVEQSPVGWIVLLAPGQDLNDVRPYADDVIKPQLERVAGVGQVWFFGGEEREVHVTVDLAALAQRGISVDQVRQALIQENRTIKAGGFDEGNRRYGVRTEGRYRRLEDIEQTIVSRDAFGSIRVKDVADVEMSNEERTFVIRQSGEPAIIFGAIQKTGSNTLDVMTKVREVVDQVNERNRDRGIELRLVYDASIYIEEALALVRSNVVLGAALAIAVLLFFLRSGRAILVLGLSIPISLISTFIFMAALGRSLNIISLAGLTFVTGMVLDSAIVVVENVFRHREMGKGAARAAGDATTEVWGAILASTLTTLVVFLPVLLIEDEVGQISRDMAIVISIAVALSLFVSMTVIPMLSANLLNKPLRESIGGRLVGRFSLWLTAKVDWILKENWRKVAVIVGIPIAALVIGRVSLLDRDYLPEGNRNLVFASIRTPPGYNLPQIERIIGSAERQILAQPEVYRMFSVVRYERAFLGVVLKEEHKDKQTLQAFVDTVRGIVTGIPGVKGAGVSQMPLIRTGRIGGGKINLVVTGPELRQIRKIADDIEFDLAKVDGVTFTDVSFEEGKPEYVVDVNRARASEVGLSVSEVGTVVEASVNGLLVGTYDDQGREIDLRLQAPKGAVTSDRELGHIVLDTPAGQTIQLADVARVDARAGPTKIEHLDMDRIVKVSLGIEKELPLGTAVANLDEVLRGHRARLPLGYAVEFTGNAADLASTELQLYGVIALAIFITYLLLASLFESFTLPLVIIMTVPFAVTGGLVGLKLLSAFDSSVKLDTITMMGFVILIGVVVNSAILIVHQTLLRLDEGLELNQAVLDGLSSRVRPIFMTTCTTAFGLLPLVLAAGSGSELYRGLGAVLVSGLIVAMIFTMVLIPTLLSAALGFRQRAPSGVASEQP